MVGVYGKGKVRHVCRYLLAGIPSSRLRYLGARSLGLSSTCSQARSRRGSIRNVGSSESLNNANDNYIPRYLGTLQILLQPPNPTTGKAIPPLYSVRGGKSTVSDAVVDKASGLVPGPGVLR